VGAESWHLSDAGLKLSDDVWALLSVFWSENLFESEAQRSDNGGISGGSSFTDQVGLGGQVLVQVSQSGEENFFTFGDYTFVVWHSSEGWEGPGRSGWGDNVFSESEPFKSLWARFTVDGGHDGAELGEVLAAGGGHDWGAGVVGETGWGGAWDKVGDFDVSAVEGSGGLDGRGIGVAGPCVKSGFNDSIVLLFISSKC
jgi:hypothetical protein